MRPPYEYDISQNVREFEEFVDLLRRERVRSYLEIGSYCGGSFWWVANWAFGDHGFAVSVDLDIDDRARVSKLACEERLRATGINATMITGNSQSSAIIEQVRALGPFDAVFIDGDHSEAAVERDWQNYGQLGRIVAFHDVCWSKSNRPGMGSPDHWRKLRGMYRSVEINRRPGEHGIGVVWREEPK